MAGPRQVLSETHLLSGCMFLLVASCQFHPFNAALASTWLLTLPSLPLQFGYPAEPQASPWNILMTLPGPGVLSGLSAVATGDGRPNALPVQLKVLPS